MRVGLVFRHRLVRGSAALVVSLTVATLLVTFLEQVAGITNASSAYLLAIVALAVRFGTVEAVLGAVGSFFLANYLFTPPVHTLTVLDPKEWLNLLLLLVVGVVVGQLAGRQRDRAEMAELREREARGLFQVSRALATAPDTGQAMRDVVRILLAETGMTRVWIGLQGPSPLERVVADTGLGSEPERASPESERAALEPSAIGRHELLKRMEGDIPARWVGLHAAPRSLRFVPGTDLAAYRVVIEADERSLGSVWALRRRLLGAPGREETRLLAAAADQVGQALERDRLRRDANTVEVTRQSEALKSALLDSVSHDLRTPIATIRAAAGSLVENPDGDGHAPVAAAIDRQAVHLDRLVTNLLDMTRIEAGELRPQLHPVLLDDAVADAVDRMGTTLAGRLEVDVPLDLPPVLVDDVYLDAVLANLLDNARKYSPDDAVIRVSACRPAPDGPVRLVVEDAGFGVADEALDRIFEKFYRAAPAAGGSPRGTGIGLAIVRGLADSMGGAVAAGRSALGGLAVTVELPAIDPPVTA